MRITRLAPLAAGALLIGATCVTSFDQRGDAGPWIGEFVNANAYRADTFEATVTVTDANGTDAGPTSIVTCPTELEPGEAATFELKLAGPPRRDLMMPLSASTPLIAAYNGLMLERYWPSLVAHTVSLDVAAGTAVIEVKNESPTGSFPADSYQEGRVCGVARDASGGVVSVSAPADTPALDPGESASITVTFTTLDGAASVDAYARSSLATIIGRGTDGSRLFDLGQFRVRLPARWHYVPAQGIDSFFGRFVSDGGAVLTFDYGWYSGNVLVDEPGYIVLHEKIDGFDATITTPFPGLKGKTELHVVDVAPRSDRAANMVTSLLISGRDLTPDQQAQALAIFRSIDFTGN